MVPTLNNIYNHIKSIMVDGSANSLIKVTLKLQRFIPKNNVLQSINYKVHEKSHYKHKNGQNDNGESLFLNSLNNDTMVRKALGMLRNKHAFPLIRFRKQTISTVDVVLKNTVIPVIKQIAYSIETKKKGSDKTDFTCGTASAKNIVNDVIRALRLNGVNSLLLIIHDI